jgi:crotonobetainyl-CoA:carnitine CoA-transferase CaiB-like acyl-CoA transferase
MAGAMSITGEADGLPQKAGYATADIFTGMYTSVAILAALRQRDATGRGAAIDCALFEAQVAVLGNQAMNYLTSGKVPGRMGNAHPNIVPYAVYPASDGHIILATGNDRQFRDAMIAIGAPDIAGDPAYASNADRIARRAQATLEQRRDRHRRGRLDEQAHILEQHAHRRDDRRLGHGQNLIDRGAEDRKRSGADRTPQAIRDGRR